MLLLLKSVTNGFPPPRLTAAQAEFRKRQEGAIEKSIAPSVFHGEAVWTQNLRFVADGFFVGRVSAEDAIEDGVDVAQLAL